MHQMHWQSYLWSKLHSMSMSSNALTKLFEFSKCWTFNDCLIAKICCSQNSTSFAMKSEEQKLVADATSFVMMSEMLHLMLTSLNALTKLFFWWRRLDNIDYALYVRFYWLRTIFFVHKRFFFFVFSDVFQIVNVVFR